VNIGTISGGTVVNRVPHEAELRLEMRAFEPGVFDDTEAGLMALTGPCPEVPGTTITVTRTGKTPPWPEDEATAGLLLLAQAAAGRLGLTMQAEHRGGLSDANYLCHLGPTLDGLGPSGAFAHCSERSADGSKTPEYVEPGSLVPKAALSVLMWKEILRS
jgi:glutamate carboxypeptidase